MTTKPNAFATMKYKALLFLSLFMGFAGVAQVKSEREFRIRESQFPALALEKAKPYLEGVRRLRFYKEIDGTRHSYEIKFKKERLHYSVEFSDSGVLEDIEVRIKPIDIPEDSWKAVEDHLDTLFTKYKVRKIQQQYPANAFPSDSAVFRNAFQNLLLPQIRYELVVQGKIPEGYRDYEILYDARGGFLNKRESLPPNYDHVLY